MNADGFDEFYRRHRDTILAYHGRRVAEPEVAADLAAETFAAALLAVHDLDRTLPEEPLVWLFTIAHRKLVDSYRRGKVDAAARQRLALEPLVLEDADIDRVIEASEEVDVTARLRASLPAAQYAALHARVLDEREYPDIARDLACSEEVVRMRVSRALKHLRAQAGSFE
jgi:RNA polymerase sigma factor (sigma-70 family)